MHVVRDLLHHLNRCKEYKDDRVLYVYELIELSQIFLLVKEKPKCNWTDWYMSMLRFNSLGSIEVYWLIIDRVGEIERESGVTLTSREILYLLSYTISEWRSIKSILASRRVWLVLQPPLYMVLSKLYQMSYIANCLWRIYKILAMIDGITNWKVMLYIGLLESKTRRLIWVHYYICSIYIFDKVHFCVL